MRRLGFTLALLAGMAAAQTPAFEVASVKLHPGEITFSADPAIRGSRVVAAALTLVDLLTYAYDARYEQISGAPAWASKDHYDINAKVAGDGPVSKEQARGMMQALLAERFSLQIHREKKEMPVYALVVAKGGHKMKESAPDAKGGNYTTGSSRGMVMEAARGTMQRLAEQLSHSAGRPVVDRTGLAGYWAYRFEWNPVAGAPDAPADAPSMFTAIQEQLGLKLEPSKAPFDMLVVDRAERPAEN